MPRVCIMDAVLGERFHLLVDDGSFRWVDSPPADAWVLGDPKADLSIDLLLKLLGKDIPSSPGRRFERAFDVITQSDPGAPYPISWRQAVPGDAFGPWIIRLLDELLMALKGEGYAYYMSTFRRTRECLGALERACVSDARVHMYMDRERNPTNKAAIWSFTPDGDGFANPIEYDQTATVTGRLIVSSGPRLLTLPKGYRNVMVSRYEGGKVLMFDYSSLEPRIALVDAGRDVPDDVYADIDEKVFGNALDRDRVKAMTISLLYGAQEEKMKYISGLDGSSLYGAIEGISSYFGVRHRRAALRKMFSEKGYITNIFGRVIRPGPDEERKLDNFFYQASAVDFALCGFANVLDFIRDEGLKAHGIGIIHDALLLDVHPSCMVYSDTLMKMGSRVDGIDASFPMRCEEI